VSSNGDDGMTILYSHYNVISGNIVSDNGYGGIYLSNSSSNNITDNTASGNFMEGIFIYLASAYNTISGNAVFDNTWGMFFNASSSNLIYDNYLTNTNNTYDNGNNSWNTTKTAGTNIVGGPYLGGNYYSDYTGNDTDGDGIGDVPYTISGGSNIDYLPLFAEPIDSTAPTWNETPTDLTVEYARPFVYDVNASDPSNISTYSIDDTVNFSINSNTGLITNATFLTVGVYGLNISVNDTYGNTLWAVISVTVEDTVPPAVTITSPRNTTYQNGSINLSVFADKTIDTWWYTLNAGPNVTFTPNATIVGQEGFNTLVVYANDTTGKTGTSTVHFAVDTTPLPLNQTTFNVTLQQGWNLVSLPLVPENTSLDAVLASISGNYSVVYAWINGDWKKSTVPAPFGGLSEMTVDYGYWIYMIAPDVLELSGTVPASTTINLSLGWNLVGYPSDTTRNLTDVLSQINYSVVYAWINGDWKKSTVPVLFGGLDDMNPGYGYWIYANGAGRYVIGN